MTGPIPQSIGLDPAAQAGVETANLLDSVLENMGHGIVVYDKDHRLLVYNPRFAEMYDLSPDELALGTHRDTVAKSVIKRNWPDEPDKAIAFLEAVPARDVNAVA